MLVVLRLAAPSADADLRAQAERALVALSRRPGWVSGRLARAVDDPQAYVLVLEWESVGAYRRSLSGYDVKVEATPLLASAVPGPSAYEEVVVLEGPAGAGADGATARVSSGDRAADADDVAVGEAAQAHVPPVGES